MQMECREAVFTNAWRNHLSCNELNFIDDQCVVDIMPECTNGTVKRVLRWLSIIMVN